MTGSRRVDVAHLHRLAVPGVVPGPVPRLAVVLEVCAALLLVIAAALVVGSTDRLPTAGWAVLLLGLPALAGLWVARRQRREHPQGVVLVQQTPDGLVVPGTSSRRRAAFLAGGLSPALTVGALGALGMSDAEVGAAAFALGLALAVVAHGVLYRVVPGRWTTPRLLLDPDGIEVVVPFVGNGLPLMLSWAEVAPLDPSSVHPVRELVASSASWVDRSEAALVGPSLLGDERAIAALVELYRTRPELRDELADGRAVDRFRAGRVPAPPG